MGKIVEYTGNYVEVINALNLFKSFYSEQETKEQYTYEIEKDLGRTDFFSLKSSRAELQNRIRTETEAQTHFSYTQGNFDGRIFSKFLMGFQPGIQAESADKADDPYFTKTIGLNYVDDRGIQCGFAISAYRNDKNLEIPIKEREYSYIITRIENVNLEPEKRKVSVLSNIPDVANHAFVDPESPPNLNGIQAVEYIPNQIIEKVASLTNSNDLNSLLAGLFNSEGSMSMDKLNELSSRFGSNTLDNRDFKIKHINSFINFAETYLKQDEKLQNDIAQLKNDISCDVNLFKGEGTDNLIISRLHDLISKSIKTYNFPETTHKLLKANDLNLFIYNLEQQYSQLQESKILNVSKEENQQFKSKINILRHYAQHPFNVDIDELPEIKSVNNFDTLIKSINLIVIDYDQMLSLLKNAQLKMPHLADTFNDEIERIMIYGNSNQGAPNSKFHLSRLIDLINKAREKELSSIKSPSEVIAPVKPEGTFFKRNGTALSIGIAAIIGTIGIALTLTGILAPIGIALSGIGFTLGLLGLGLGAGVSLVAAGSIIAKENHHQAQLEKYPQDMKKYDTDVVEFKNLREKNNEAKIEINDRYDNSIKHVDESIISIIGTPSVQDKPDEFLDNSINIKSSKALEVNEDNESEDFLNILREPEDPSDFIMKSETSYQSEAKARSTVTTLDKLFYEGESALQQANEIQLNPKVISTKETKKITIPKKTNEEDIETKDHKFNQS
ncbi:MAG TPA: hypothetical protein PK657_10140 [Legionella sp.]|nr:hypothetical protein [Legionella sp.]